MDPRAQCRPKPARLHAWIPVLALAVLAGGCATSKQEHRLEEEASRFIYVAPPPKVLGEARALLEKHGYTVQTNPDNPNVISTPWREIYAGEEMGTQVRRYLVMGKDVGGGRFIVRIFNITYTTVGTVDAHPSLGNHAYENGGGSREGGGQRSSFMVKGQGAAPAKGWYQRDLEMEWHLLQRLEPELAQEMQQGTAQGSASPTATASRAK